MKKKHYICVFLFTSFAMLMFTFWDFLMFYPPSSTLKEILTTITFYEHFIVYGIIANFTVMVSINIIIWIFRKLS